VGRRLAEAARLGFKVALIPRGSTSAEQGDMPAGMQVHEVGAVNTALRLAAQVSSE
jgi:DNA repair protein RadA/Sms